MNKPIKVIVIVSCLILSVKGGLLLFNDEAVEPINKTVQTATKVNHFSKADLVESLKHHEASETLPLDGDATDEIAIWSQKQFGYFHLQKDSDYDDYDIATLDALGAQGDLKALDILALKYLDSLDAESAIKTYQKAAIWGSTKALVQLGHLTSVPVIKGQTRSERLMQVAQVRLAYFQAGILRGDNTLLLEADSFLKVRKLLLTPKEKLIVQLKGQAIHKELQAGRIKLGLSNFPSMPSTVKAFYSSVEQAAPKLITGDSPLFILNKS